MSSANELSDSDELSAFHRLRRGLARTRAGLGRGLRALVGEGALDEQMLEDLGDLLLSADTGVEASRSILEELERRGRGAASAGEVLQILEELLYRRLAACEQPLDVSTAAPFVILVVGVNGVGKTTTIGKLAMRFRAEGREVVLAAADTFRAAASEQLLRWGERSGASVISQGEGADAASVAHDALQSARARGADVLIVDTAGRQHTHHNLMEELAKIRRVIERLEPGAPHEVLLVVDAGNGQNVLSQLQRFGEAVGVTGMAMTKLDGTAKGGILLALAAHGAPPVRFIGVGEDPRDLRPFEARGFVTALLAEPEG
ncbi:MAG: signal recognition particle-docking protein FtsY [Gammaproteobacteria bacterium]|nr:signal recognition particle-docking protein FtsY [Gammaproteobacteria bacterium]